MVNAGVSGWQNLPKLIIYLYMWNALLSRIVSSVKPWQRIGVTRWKRLKDNKLPNALESTQGELQENISLVRCPPLYGARVINRSGTVVILYIIAFVCFYADEGVFLLQRFVTLSIAKSPDVTTILRLNKVNWVQRDSSADASEWQDNTISLSLSGSYYGN